MTARTARWVIVLTSLSLGCNSSLKPSAIEGHWSGSLPFSHGQDVIDIRFTIENQRLVGIACRMRILSGSPFLVFNDVPVLINADRVTFAEYSGEFRREGSQQYLDLRSSSGAEFSLMPGGDYCRQD
jgi:hypothetical protein